jgi:hypothetical protein
MKPESIKCRAKRLDNGEVVEGWYVPVDEHRMAIQVDTTSGDPWDKVIFKRIDPATLQLCSEAELKIKPKEFKDFWNGYEQLPKITTMTGKRNRQLQARSKEPLFADEWQIAINKLAKSPFCTGESGWKADVTWFLANDNNYIKVLEGKYDRKVEPKQKDVGMSKLAIERMNSGQP